MNLLRLLLSLLVAAARPAQGQDSTDRVRPAPGKVGPPIPRQARRTFDRVTDLLAREHPDWRVFAIPTGRGRCLAAKNAATTVYADSAEGLRRRIRQVDEEPQPDLVRAYIDWQVSA